MEDLNKALEDLNRKDESEIDIKGRGIVVESEDSNYSSIHLCTIHLCNGVKIRKPKSIIVEGDLMIIVPSYLFCDAGLIQQLEGIKGARKFKFVGRRAAVDEKQFLINYLSGNQHTRGHGNMVSRAEMYGILPKRIAQDVQAGHYLLLREEELLLFYDIMRPRHSEADITGRTNKPSKYIYYYPIDQTRKAINGIERIMIAGEHHFLNHHNIKGRHKPILTKFIMHIMQSL
jgi:hypothetical protein